MHTTLIISLTSNCHMDSLYMFWTSTRSCFVWRFWTRKHMSLLVTKCDHPNVLSLLFQVLCNGPGTCIPLCVAALLLGILGMKKVLIVYVESICRVHTLSLTGKLLYMVSDYFFVQWSSLRDKYPKSIFLGRIVWCLLLHKLYTNEKSNRVSKMEEGCVQCFILKSNPWQALS